MRATMSPAPAPLAPIRTDSDRMQAQTLAARLFSAGLAASELLAVYVGVRLGLYEALRSSGPATPSLLAARAGIAPRYAREWLEQQSAAGILDVDGADKAADQRLYLLPPGHAETLLDVESPFSMGAMALLSAGAARATDKLVDAYRTGGGVPFADYGSEFHTAQAMLNRPLFRHQLAGWIARALPDVHEQLAAGAIRVADVGCGAGWSTCAIARAYPRVRVDGFDLHEPALDEARRRTRAERLDDRVTFAAQDVTALAAVPRYGLICIFDALHDMSRPVEMLRACRGLVARKGVVLLMEPRAAETWATPATDIERFLYAVSLLHCLPVGMCDPESEGTGTVMRPATVRRYAADAGFTRVDTLSIEHRFYRFYRVSP
jgi:2-polyprenyl-3-methyl-5-hydroxy-6-metoxy-1,4-benzoquinol methylase